MKAELGWKPLELEKEDKGKGMFDFRTPVFTHSQTFVRLSHYQNGQYNAPEYIMINLWVNCK